MALGYEDIIDHDTLRFDPALKLLASPGTEYPGTPAPLAGKSTLSRLEQSWETGNRRYHQMVPNLKSLSNLFVALFLDACDTPPARITHAPFPGESVPRPARPATRTPYPRPGSTVRPRRTTALRRQACGYWSPAFIRTNNS